MKGDSKETLILLFFNAPISFHLLFSFFNVSSTLLANFFFSIYDHLIPIRSTCNDDDAGYHAFRHEEEHDHQYASQKKMVMDSSVLICSCSRKRIIWWLISFMVENPSYLYLSRVPKKEQVVFYEVSAARRKLFSKKMALMKLKNIIFTNISLKKILKKTELIIMEEEHSPEYFSPPEDSDEEASELDVAVDIHHQEEELSLLKDSDANSATTTMVFISTDPSENGYITPVQIDLNNSGPVPNDDTSSEEERDGKESKAVKNTMETKLLEDGKFFVLQPKKIQKNMLIDVKNSSEWRSSVNYRVSGTGDDPFSTSSRRSCPTWESYTVFRKYDEEMLFLDRISAQKLSETESLRAIEACPRSISQEIVHKLTTKNKPNTTSSANLKICLTWEALNWNYKNYQRLKATYNPIPGFITTVYIENEPYEHGRRPEIYARIRNSAPKLLQVPEFRESEEDNNKEAGFANMTVSSIKFSRVMEDAIRTFMKFLKKEDKEKPCDIFKAFFSKETLTNRLKTCVAGKCIRKRKLKEEEEMEILMSLIDLKVIVGFTNDRNK
ncbi:hypothetical protein MKW92_008731 [Papaver armeniacum]|nr:hypothetical protein MKW92_008731 [Papaver armeniacum]